MSPKTVEGSALFQIYQAFATPPESSTLRQAYADGIAWSDAKQMVFERIDDEIAPLREVYQALLDDPARIESILRAGAAKARHIATPFMGRLRQAVGLRDLRTQSSKAAKSVKIRLAGLQTIPRKRRSVLLQTVGYGGPFAAAKYGLCFTQSGRPNHCHAADPRCERLE